MRKVLCLLVGLVMGISAVHAQDTSLFILFPGNSSNLERVGTDQAIKNNEVFTEVARILAENPRQRILIDGHANPVIGTSQEERNVLAALSQKRAEIAAEFLVKYYNIDPSRIILASAGGRLAVSRSSEAYLNRRVNFFIVEPR
ncbi:MAG: OmpA family protein [Treponema sp.]|nr:OmpA family protein [Treponema sp.]